MTKFLLSWLQVVPHCWHIINNQDAVARSPKFLVLYKRAGQRVLINNNGDMLVRPSFIENSILQMPGGLQLPLTKKISLLSNLCNLQGRHMCPLSVLIESEPCKAQIYRIGNSVGHRKLQDQENVQVLHCALNNIF